MGNGVRKASQTSIEIRFSYKGVMCQERIKIKPDKKGIKFAENKKATIDYEIGLGTFSYKDHFPNSKKALTFSTLKGDVITVGEYLESWLEDSKEYLKSSTYESYEGIINFHLSPTFGNLALTELSRKHVKDWIRTHSDLSSKRISNVISPLRIMLDEALDEDLIEHNVLAGWKIKRKRTKGVRKDPIDPFSYDETNQILAAFTGSNLNVIEFWFNTGLRPSELVALDWGDIDWVNRTVRIDKALTAAADKSKEDIKIEIPKTEAGNRDVKLNDRALEALERQKQYSHFKNEEIFTNSKGERWAGGFPIRDTIWKNALRKAKVRYRYPYQVRHTRISTLLMAGENPMWVSTQAGHRSWTFTATTYSRFIPNNANDSGSLEQAEYEKSTRKCTQN